MIMITNRYIAKRHFDNEQYASCAKYYILECKKESKQRGVGHNRRCNLKHYGITKQRN